MRGDHRGRLGLSVRRPDAGRADRRASASAPGRREGSGDQICLADTIGTTVPGRVLELISAVRDECPDTPLAMHFYDTRGSRVANVVAALSQGVTQFDASIGGLGGCPFAPGASGNIATEDLVYVLDGSGASTGLDLDRLLDAAQLGAHGRRS